MIACSVRVRESHCVRVRYAKSTCTLCADACPHDAIELESAPVIDSSKCTGCMACVTACRTAALEAPSVLFWEAVRQLADATGPVLGCSLAPVEIEAHATLPCVGYLAPEYLVALAVLRSDGITLNLTACEQCANHAVAERAIAQIERVHATLSSDMGERLKPIVSSEEFEYEAPVTDRRGLFAALGSMVRGQVLTVLAESKDTDVGKTPYWEKIVPRERLALERIIEALRVNGDVPSMPAVCGLLGYTMRISDQCQLCFGCVGMCPNGALDSVEEDTVVDGEEVYREELLFRPASCGGCGLCEEFCTSRAITVESGCRPDDVLEWSTIYDVMQES